MDMAQSEVTRYWQGITGTLAQRGLLKMRPQRGGHAFPVADAFLLPERVVFILDMQRLAGIAREQWLDRRLWAQWRAALQGRRVIVSDGGGLAVQVARQPGEHVKRLPAMIPLDLGDLPDEPYTVTLGHSTRGPVTLDVAGNHRAILCGGASGKGKTNLMQSVVLQLCAKHTPAQFQVAIIDTKQVDFGAVFVRLPHLFAPIAHDLDEAERLIEHVEQERQRRQALMAQAGVADWRDLDGLGLLLLVVDEAADFAKTPAMETLVEVARKGRAMGVSLIVGTQLPSARVIDAQVRANLPTAIAFQCRSHIESQAILGRKGAEGLNRPGLALTFTGSRWERVQTLRVDLEALGDVAAPPTPALSDTERALVRFAVKELDGAFTVNAIYEAHKDQVSKYALTKLAQRWERRGWLTEPQRTPDGHKVGRQVTAELARLAMPDHITAHVTTEAPTSRDITDSTTSRRETAGAGDGDIPAFVAELFGNRLTQGGAM